MRVRAHTHTHTHWIHLCIFIRTHIHSHAHTHTHTQPGKTLSEQANTKECSHPGRWNSTVSTSGQTGKAQQGEQHSTVSTSGQTGQTAMTEHSPPGANTVISVEPECKGKATPGGVSASDMCDNTTFQWSGEDLVFSSRERHMEPQSCYTNKQALHTTRLLDQYPQLLAQVT